MALKFNDFFQNVTDVYYTTNSVVLLLLIHFVHAYTGKPILNVYQHLPMSTIEHVDPLVMISKSVTSFSSVFGKKGGKEI